MGTHHFGRISFLISDSAHLPLSDFFYFVKLRHSALLAFFFFSYGTLRRGEN
jgi:hypothetical protein